MADEKIIVEVEVDTRAAEKNIQKQSQLISDLTQANKELTASNKELSKDYSANSKQISQNNAEIAKNRSVITEANKSRRDSINAVKTETGSLNALRQSLSRNVKERNSINRSTKEGQKEFARLNKVILDQTNELKAAEQAGGDFRRSVGDYASAFGNAASAAGGFGSVLGSVFTAIATNPVGLLITALAGLVKIFAETQSGAEFFRKTGAALNTVFGLLSDSVESLGNLLISAFSEPQQALSDLGDLIVDGIGFYFTEFIPNAINNVLEGFGLLGQAVKQVFEGEFDAALETASQGTAKLVDGVTDLNPVTAALKTTYEAITPVIAQVADEIERTTSAAFGLEEALIANEKAQADQQVVVAQSIRSQKELNLLIEDQTASTADRIAAAEEFARVEEAQINRSIQLQRERIEILKAQNDLTNSTEEDIQRVRDAEIELANLQAASFERQVTNQNKLNTIRQQEAAQLEAEKKKQEAEDEAFFAKNDEIRAKEREARLKQQAEDEELDKQKAEAKTNLALGGLALVQEVSEKESAINKAAAIGAATINTFQAITATLSNAQIPPPFNIALAGLTGAFGFAQVANIAGVQFANGGLVDGGMFSGPSHAGGGIKFAAGGRIMEAEGGEAIINKRSTSMFKPVLSAINAAGGGRRFAKGGEIPKFANGGISFAGGQTSSIDSVIASENSVANQLSRQAPVQVAVTDINTTQDRVQVKDRRATV